MKQRDNYIVQKCCLEGVPCKEACPAHIDIPRYIRLIGAGKFAEAVAVVREKVPLPAILGRVCQRPCEEKCKRSEVDNPVGINALKRFITEQDTGQWKQYLKVSPATGKKVAIVGSGPAGLTAGYYLAKLGHSVTIFEMSPQPGGMMRVGIPEYRLPRHILDAEIEAIQQVGIDIKTDTKVESVNELLQKGYDAVFVAVGSHKSRRIGVEGEDSPGVIDGLAFLKEVNSGEKPNIGNRVAVVGGGNVAVDSARTARRLGADSVTILYRRSRNEMPASVSEVEQALMENINIVFLATPSKITLVNDVLSVECLRTQLGVSDVSGRRQPMPIEGSEFSREFDTVIAAIGELPDIPRQFELPINDDNTLRVDLATLATPRNGVFAGGDVVSGPASVIEAIAAGRRAAISIDKYLGGKGIIDEVLASPEKIEPWFGFDESILFIERCPILSTKIAGRVKNFDEVELGFTTEEALTEAQRCLRCDQQVKVLIDYDRCTECCICQQYCSLIYQRVCNIEKAYITIDLPQISWTGDCVGGCILCIQHCPRGAIALEQEN